jgi:signal transduction histidine kinase
VKRRSIGFPLTLGVVLTLMALGLGVGWQILVVGELEPMARGLSAVQWLLIVLGSVFFVLIIVGLLLLCVWLVREMRLNQRQQAFLDAVTHEMKTPLAALRLYLETLDRHDPAPERRRAFLSRMQEDVERLERTVSQVLVAARAEAPARRSSSEPVELSDLLEPNIQEIRGSSSEPVELSDLLEPNIQEIRERHGLPEGAIRLVRRGPALALGNGAELSVVFRNLLENAVKYSEPPEEVTVTIERTPDGRVEVKIVDRGIGIERRELRKIFQRFYQAGRDVQRQAAGLGLGLFIVGNLVRRNGGRVVASSEGSGRGSRFVVTLRGTEEPPIEPIESLEAPRTQQAGGTP